MENNLKFRLITYGDFDGLVCYILLSKLDLISEVMFINPLEVKLGDIIPNNRDIFANLPYIPGVFMSFDRHNQGIKKQERNFIIEYEAHSVARVIANYFNLEEKFPFVFNNLLDHLDTTNEALLTTDDILNPKDWVLLSFILDPLTGLNRFHDFSKSHEQTLRDLAQNFEKLSIEQILSLPDIVERIHIYKTYQDHFIKQIKRCSTTYKHLVVVDLSHEDIIYPGNPFMVYALYPEADISMIIQNSGDTSDFEIGASIINLNNSLDIGAMLRSMGGSGHKKEGKIKCAQSDKNNLKMKLIESILLEG